MTEPDRLHFSDLKLIGTSPLHYKTRPKKRTRSLSVGSGLHAMLFDTARVVCYEGIRRGKKWESFAEEHQDALLMIESEYHPIKGMASAIRRHTVAMRLLEGEREQTIQWRMAGFDCEGTPDVFKVNEYDAEDSLVELKTTASSDPRRFIRDTWKYHYPAQLAWYRQGLLESKRANPQHHYIVAVESSAPYPVTVFRVTEQAIERGERTWRLWLERLKVCRESDYWPAYTESIVDIDAEDDGPFEITSGGNPL